jgi:hypothetical protein
MPGSLHATVTGGAIVFPRGELVRLFWMCINSLRFYYMNTVKDFRLPRKLASIYRRECNEECRDYNVVQEKQEGRY